MRAQILVEGGASADLTRLTVLKEVQEVGLAFTAIGHRGTL